jgi:hypothetical protein
MNLLQKLENTYLAILRLTVLVVSGLMLVAAVLLGISSLGGLRGDAPPDKTVPTVSAAQIVTDLTQPAAREGASLPEQGKSGGARAVDSNEAAYKRATESIAAFIAKHSAGRMTANKPVVMGLVKRQAESQTSPELVKAYADGLAVALDTVLADPKIIAQVSRFATAEDATGNTASTAQGSANPADVVDALLGKYSIQFQRQLADLRTKEAERQGAQAEKKAEATMKLYMAGGAFGLFLLVVTLSIFIRIERNLRPLDRLNTGGQT